MTAVPKRLLTPAEYLARERAAAFKSEFYAGETFAMAGASYEHTRIADNLVRLLGVALDGGPCFVLSRDMRVKVSATGLYTYPDVLVVCGRPELEDDQGDVLLNPRVIIEVLSESTERYDRTTKFDHYRRIPSLQEYVLVAQDVARIERFVRQPDGPWAHEAFTDPAGTFALATVPASVRLADVYRGATLPAPPPPPEPVSPPATARPPRPG
jgi:Uma2 family endonuclease